MLRIGITGGIGSGKTTVCRLFAALGVPIIDADVVAREIVLPGRPALEQLRKTFGGEIVSSTGELDRPQLRRLAFADAGTRRQLETILHPAIHAEIVHQIARISAPYCLIAIPLLFESGWEELVDRVLVVDTMPEQQIRRTMHRDGLTVGEIEAIMAVQCSREARLAGANDIIHNSGELTDLDRQVASLHSYYLELAGKRR